ncbi:uncharacterized protein PHACADRAFT_152576 [Phanerochaete carnosa HHB-10118-sp]|uniref:Cryptic loci regulator 2 N-terminal domain-containing protein n=1 Tax=Phanerochaete carnosa (strain HHB-10118-sp) TaxID=650164 RepID=K5WJU0_PHACS|nr:uncharacterized protein PHACADRAFT_152576 [Phanerochaete carnosa HHB-10118-sp]EKM50522.1 hypothetical protein PHACADRAFT_152576 [Phanerochaete carnosa HHB-10118-sp]
MSFRVAEPVPVDSELGESLAQPVLSAQPLRSQCGGRDSALRRRGVSIDITNVYGVVNFTIIAPFYTANTNNRVVVTSPGRDATDVDLSLRRASMLKADGMPSRAMPAPEERQKWWKKKLGMFIVKDVLVDELDRNHHRWPRHAIVQGRLHSFPAGYTLMYIPRLKDSDHKDVYLYSTDGKRKWRSPEEFGPHLAWLLTGQRRDIAGRCVCECCVCIKARTGESPRQSNITRRYEDIDSYFAAQSSMKVARRPKARKNAPPSNDSLSIKQIIARAKDYSKWKTSTTSLAAEKGVGER